MKLDFFLLEFFKLVKFTLYNKKAAGRTLLHVAGRQLHLGLWAGANNFMLQSETFFLSKKKLVVTVQKVHTSVACV
jgi:hypothetical protein